jgi:hypothetical protein
MRALATVEVCVRLPEIWVSIRALAHLRLTRRTMPGNEIMPIARDFLAQAGQGAVGYGRSCSARGCQWLVAGSTYGPLGCLGAGAEPNRPGDCVWSPEDLGGMASPRLRLITHEDV